MATRRIVPTAASRTASALSRALEDDLGGDREALRKGALAALAGGEDLDVVDSKGRTALWCAVRGNDAEMVRALLDAGASLEAHAPEPCGFTTDVTRKLPKKQVRKDYGSRGTLLHDAAWANASDVVGLLLEHFPVDVTDRQGNTPLHAACHTSAVQASAVLLAAGASARSHDGWGNSALHIATRTAPCADIFVQLLGHGADVDEADPNGASPIASLAAHAEANVLRVLTRAGADPRKHLGAVALAAQAGNTESARALIETGFSPDDVLVDARADAAFLERVPAIAAAARRFHADTVDYLAAAGATALDLALVWGAGSPALVGSKVNRTTSATERLGRPAEGKPALEGVFPYAESTPEKQRARRAILTRLLDAGAAVDNVQFAIPTALQGAAWAGLDETVTFLLSRGAQVDVRDTFGRTALWYAAEAGQARIVRLLLAAGADVRISSHPLVAGSPDEFLTTTEARNKAPVDVARDPPIHARHAGHREVVSLLETR